MAYMYLFYSLLVVLSSWIRWHFTGSLKADDNFIYEPSYALWLCVALYHIGIIGMSYTLYNIVVQNENYRISKSQTIRISVLSILLFTGMTVMFASDIYTYLAEGELLTRGILTYTDGSLVRQSKFIDYVSDWWKECPNHYGSPLLFLFGVACYTGKTLFKSYIVFKLILMLIGILLINLVSKIENTLPEKKYNFFALAILSPILLIEGIGQTHVEIVITTLLAAAILSMNYKKIYFAAFFIGLAMACKIMYGIILLPLLISLAYASNRAENKKWMNFFFSALSCVAICVLIVVLSYIPIWQGIETITNPISYHGTKTPSRSYTEILILINRYGSELIRNGLSIPDLLLRAQQPDFNSISEAIRQKNKIAPFFSILGLLIAAWNLLPLIAVKKVNSVYYYFAKLWIIIITIYSPIFNPWYFMPIILLMIYSQKLSWIFYLTVITSISINYQIGNTIAPNSYLNILVSFNMILMLILFMYKFKKHFIIEPYIELRNLLTNKSY
ncbi:MAG: hypothetical protein JNL75_08480 [Chitinophagales bacterium]|nr:hypothetical protein [Chitinophagales bacterium]